MKVKILVLFFVLFLFSSLSESKENLLNIDSDLTFSVENFEGATYFHFKTEKEYYHYNNKIRYKISTKGNFVKIFMLDIQKCFQCSPAIGPATCSIPFDFKKKDYTIIIYHKDKIDKYKVKIKNHILSIDIIERHFTMPIKLDFSLKKKF